MNDTEILNEVLKRAKDLARAIALKENPSQRELGRCDTADSLIMQIQSDRLAQSLLKRKKKK